MTPLACILPRGTLSVRAFATGAGAPVLLTSATAEGWPGQASIYTDLTDADSRAQLRAFAEAITAAVDAVEVGR